MTAKKLLYRSWRYPLTLLAFLLPVLRAAAWAKEPGSLFSCFALAFGGLRIGDSPDLFDIILTAAPYLLALYLFSSVMRDDFKINSVYVFTRMEKKSRWLNRKTGELLLQTLAVWLMLFFMAFFTGLCSGLRCSAPSLPLAGAYLALFFCNAASFFFFVYLLNVLSLRCGAARSFLYVLLLYVGSLIAALALFNRSRAGNLVAFLLPASNQMYLWHEESAPFAGDLCRNRLNGFRMADSVVIVAASAAAVYFAARRMLKKYDAVELFKEE